MLQYEEVISQLQERLPMFARQGGNALKKGLTNITGLCAGLGNPQNTFPAVHIAGTNGKGSVSHLLAAAFQQQGYRTGLYTSPHLIDLRERFRVDGAMISKEFVVRFMDQAAPLIEQWQPSYFELTVAMAFAAFAEAEVDIAIIETGMGGRLDSTNILLPVLSVITNVGFDHMQFLGNTLDAIAGEKAGIMKPDTPVLIGERQPEIEKLWIQSAMIQKSPLYFADHLWGVVATKRDGRQQQYKCVDQINKTMLTVHTDLLGSYQKNNIKTALAALTLLQEQGWKVSPETAVSAFASVKATTGLRGRWDILQRHPTVIVDVAHNAPAAAFLQQNLETLQPEASDGTLHILLGFVKDKALADVLPYFPKDATYYFTQAAIPRALAPDQLQEQAALFSLKGNTYATVALALDAALAKMRDIDTLLITGSFFIAGAAISALATR